MDENFLSLASDEGREKCSHSWARSTNVSLRHIMKYSFGWEDYDYCYKCGSFRAVQ